MLSGKGMAVLLVSEQLLLLPKRQAHFFSVSAAFCGNSFARKFARKNRMAPVVLLASRECVLLKMQQRSGHREKALHLCKADVKVRKTFLACDVADECRCHVEHPTLMSLSVYLDFLARII